MPPRTAKPVAVKPANAKTLALKPADRALLSRTEAAAYCSVNEKLWTIWTESGRAPRPIRIDDNSHPRWSRAEIDKWVAEGCPRVY